MDTLGSTGRVVLSERASASPDTYWVISALSRAALVRVDSVTVFNAHDSQRPAPEPHRYAPAGMGKVVCGSCQRHADDPAHKKWQADQIGADATQCPGCDEIWPIELTVRMMRFVRPDGRELNGRSLRICQECAGTPVDSWALLALRRDKGWITEDRYIEKLQALAERTASEAPRICGNKGRWGTCTNVMGHPDAHRYTAVRSQQQ